MIYVIWVTATAVAAVTAAGVTAVTAVISAIAETDHRDSGTADVAVQRATAPCNRIGASSSLHRRNVEVRSRVSLERRARHNQNISRPDGPAAWQRGHARV